MADSGNENAKWECAVVVLGDIGRSPRMCNHAKMLADQGFLVNIVGFLDSTPNKHIMDNQNIRILSIPPPPDFFDKFTPIFQLPIKLIWNFLTLFFVLLFRTQNLSLIILQNPPALPTIPVCFLISKMKKSKLIIDWHNYMYSILKDKYELSDEQIQENKSKKAKIVGIIAFLEGFFGKCADYNLCVTNAMKNDLKSKWGITADTFYDRPPTWKFSKPSPLEIHNVYNKIGLENIITTEKNGKIEILEPFERPLVLLSSTSWTPDEKFEILLDCLFEYNDSKNSNDPKILMIITGKGPLKQSYLEIIEKRKMENVKIITPWLEADDYPVILYSADIGVSLHISTSGLDLPMKVVDMFGAKVGVLAKNFNCIGELVKVGENGYIFDDSGELLRCLRKLIENYPNELEKLKKNVQSQNFETWEDMWTSTAQKSANMFYPSSSPPPKSWLIRLALGAFLSLSLSYLTL
ncbi:unnamed protein product [Caenorhabditis angaria]|uniref:Beta-1,4-mannosyltransferase n=1 Tax=Caenorhabditis angaria TaxID=860376 RepID=A0A9P1IK23_9PELO|nr:unnamed protein product [Caenorhabditis angaria]